MAHALLRRRSALLAALAAVAGLASVATAAPQLRLSPAGATLSVGKTHTMIASFFDGSNGIVGVKLGFAVDGANAGAPFTCVPADCRTDAKGQVHFSYVGTNAGTDAPRTWVDTNENGVQDPGEQVVICSAKWVRCGCTTTTTTTSTTTTTTQPGTGNQCFEVKNFQFPPIRGVTVVDRFGTSNVALERPTRLCTPAVIAGLPGGTSNLTGYPCRDPGFTPLRNVTVTTSFGTLALDVLQPDFTLVPTAIATGSPPPPPVAPLPDSFQCHFIQAARGTPRAPVIHGITVSDGIGGSYTVDLIEPRRLCAPADVNGGAPGAGSRTDLLLCYRGRSRANFGDARIAAHDAFGALRLRLIRRLEVCIPATVQ